MFRNINKFVALLGAGLLVAFVAVEGGRHDAHAQLLDNLFPKEEAAPRREVPPSHEVAQYSFAPIVRKAAPAVVNVYVQRRVQTFSSPFAADPFFRQFFGDAFGQPSERIQSSLGSGVIVSPDGIVVTNTHVVTLDGATGDATIRVTTSDGRVYDAEVVGTDPTYDLAVIKLKDAEDLTPISFADSSKLNVGDTTVAVGAPLGLANSVTEGIVSALNRSISIASSAAPDTGGRTLETFSRAWQRLPVPLATFLGARLRRYFSN